MGKISFPGKRINKLKYRFRIVVEYFIFVLLCLLIMLIKNNSAPDTLDLSGEAVIHIQDGKFVQNSYEYREGDVVRLKITFPEEYTGKEIEVIYKDHTSGKSINVYSGNARELITTTFTVMENGKADIVILTDPEENIITEQAELFIKIKHPAQWQENIKP